MPFFELTGRGGVPPAEADRTNPGILPRQPPAFAFAFALAARDYGRYRGRHAPGAGGPRNTPIFRRPRPVHSTGGYRAGRTPRPSFPRGRRRVRAARASFARTAALEGSPRAAIMSEVPPGVASVREVALRVRRKLEHLASLTPADLKSEQAALRSTYIDTLQRENTSLTDRIRDLKRLILTEGVPPDSEREQLSARGDWGGACSLRGLLWKVMLGAIHVDAELYIRLVDAGPTWKNEAICRDIYRVFQGNEKFKERVPNDKMARVLNAYVRLNFSENDDDGVRHLDEEDLTSPLIVSYVQPMAAIVAPLLYVMPEPAAFFAFNTLLTKLCPQYVAPDLSGGVTSVRLLRRVLEQVDPVLAAHLESTGSGDWPSVTVMFHAANSFLAVLPPLSEVVQIWDMLFAFGVHASVFVMAAQLVLHRTPLLAEPNPIRLLQQNTAPTLDAATLVPAALKVATMVSDDLFDEVAAHPFMSQEQFARARRPDPDPRPLGHGLSPTAARARPRSSKGAKGRRATSSERRRDGQRKTVGALKVLGKERSPGQALLDYRARSNSDRGPRPAFR